MKTKYKFRFEHNVDPEPTEITVKVNRKNINDTLFKTKEVSNNIVYEDCVMHDDGNGITINGFRLDYHDILPIFTALSAYVDLEYKTYIGKK